VYLTEHGDETAYARMRDGLGRFLEQHGIDAAKYHETLTRAWILAVPISWNSPPVPTRSMSWLGRTRRGWTIG
jgi:hypothetical protein